jgi:hypothetical protein
VDTFASLKDWISIVAVVISLISLGISLRNRQRDIDRERENSIRAKAWEILNNEPGYRTVNALDDPDNQTDTRIKLLERTAEQLRLAGAPKLGDQLTSFLDKNQWPDADAKTKRARDDFRMAAAEFIKPK